MKADFKLLPISLGKGIRLYIDGKHVKTISKKYTLVWDADFIKDLSVKRPTKSEKISLYIFLKAKKEAIKTAQKLERKAKILTDFIQKLAETDYYVYELIKNAEPIEARSVEKHSGETWKEILFNNKQRIKVPLNVFLSLSEIQTNKIFYTN